MEELFKNYQNLPTYYTSKLLLFLSKCSFHMSKLKESEKCFECGFRNFSDFKLFFLWICFSRAQRLCKEEIEEDNSSSYALSTKLNDLKVILIIILWNNKRSNYLKIFSLWNLISPYFAFIIWIGSFFLRLHVQWPQKSHYKDRNFINYWNKSQNWDNHAKE